MATKILSAIAIMFLAISPASAWSDIDRMKAANALGNLLGSETACGLTFDQEAVSRYIDENVPADDMEFAPMLDMMATGAEVQIKEMVGSRKAAHCRLVERAAKSHSFIK